MTLKKKEKIWLLVLLVIGFLYCVIEAFNEGDLYIYLCAAGDLTTHEDIYVKGYIFEQYHYYYSVLFAILLNPFYTLPFYWVKLCWLLLNLFLYIHLLVLLARSKFVSDLPLRRQRLFLILAAVFSLRFLHENIHAAQVTILILWCAVYGLSLIIRERYVAGAFLLAIGINIKLLPVVFVPYLVYRGYFKAALATVCFLIAAMFLPSLIIGHEYNMALLSSWLKIINPSNTQHILDTDERSFHGLSTLLATLFVGQVPDLYALPLKRNIADVSVETLSQILMAVRISLIALTLYFTGLRAFRRPADQWQQLVEISYILLLIPLIFPHQQHYAFLFIAPAFTLSLCYLFIKNETLTNRERKTLAVILSLIYLAGNLRMLLGEFNRYYEHFKILTYGALLLIPLLMWISRRKAAL